MTADIMRRRLDELWRAYLLDDHADVDAAIRTRGKAAVEFLDGLRLAHEDAREKGDIDLAIKATDRAFAVWSLIGIEFGAWMLDEVSFDFRCRPANGNTRAVLLHQLHRAREIFPPGHASQLDAAPVLLPRWLLDELTEALQALTKGEVQPLLAAAPNRRHDEAWTRDEMRVRALQHVEFLRGQGLSVGLARKRVALAVGAAVDTLRKWEVECREHVRDLAGRLEWARVAGEIKVRRESDPDDRSAVDANAWDLLRQFRAESLAEFGRSYQDRFGRRHFNPESGGK